MECLTDEEFSFLFQKKAVDFLENTDPYIAHVTECDKCAKHFLRLVRERIQVEERKRRLLIEWSAGQTKH